MLVYALMRNATPRQARPGRQNWELNSLNGSLLRLWVSGYFVINDRPIGGPQKTQPRRLQPTRASERERAEKNEEDEEEWAEEWALCNAPAVSYVSRLHRLPSTHRQCAPTSPPSYCCSRAWPGGWGCNPHMSLPHFDLWLIPNCNRVNNRLFSGLITGCSLSHSTRSLSLPPSYSLSPPFRVFLRTVIMPCRAVLLPQLLPLASVVYCSNSTLSICNFRSNSAPLR